MPITSNYRLAKILEFAKDLSVTVTKHAASLKADSRQPTQFHRLSCAKRGILFQTQTPTIRYQPDLMVLPFSCAKYTNTHAY